MNMRFLLIIIIFFIRGVSFGQHQHSGFCGTTIEDQALMDKLHPNDFRGDLSAKRNATTYIPVKFHLTANSDGSGRIEIIHVINQLCILNQDYAASNIVFYLYDGFNFINQTNIYIAPGANSSSVRARKDPRSLNVFITENADPQGDVVGTVLGFYSPQGDYIVIRKKELLDKTSTLSHEIGHFLSLRHTFYGWEGAPYDKSIHGETVTFNTVPGGISGIAVELMDKSNCATAADMICDTPPDYNFGFGASSCNFTTTVYDKNGDKIDPMENNQMSYFLTCSNYEFTEGQNARMLTNYNSSSRNYLRSNYIPNTTVINVEPKLTLPSSGEKVNSFDNVKLDWDDVPGASSYLIEIKGQNQYYWQITTSSEYVSKELKKNNFYVWSVKPFNEGNGCSQAKTSNFRTGDGTSSLSKTSETISKIKIIPNIIENSILNLELSSSISGNSQIDIINLEGQLSSSNKFRLLEGNNQLTLDIDALPKGLYLMIASLDGHRKVEKFVKL